MSLPSPLIAVIALTLYVFGCPLPSILAPLGPLRRHLCHLHAERQAHDPRFWWSWNCQERQGRRPQDQGRCLWCIFSCRRSISRLPFSILLLRLMVIPLSSFLSTSVPLMFLLLDRTSRLLPWRPPPWPVLFPLSLPLVLTALLSMPPPLRVRSSTASTSPSSSKGNMRHHLRSLL